MLRVVHTIILLFFLVAIAVSGFGQSDSSGRSDGYRFVDAAFHSMSSPVRWKSKDWQKFIVISGGMAALTVVDQPVRELWTSLDNKLLDRVNAVGDKYGTTYGALVFSGGFYFGGMLFKNEWARETGVMLGSALLTSCVVQTALKPLIGRARPFMEEGNYAFDPLQKERGWHSFPSGHTSVALTISFVMAQRVHSLPLKLLFYSLAWFSARSAVKRVQSTRFKQSVTERWSLSPYPGGLTLRVKL
jgi:membrane-associated phospholipid phosphatase